MNIEEVVEYVKRNPEWRLSCQVHKLINIKNKRTLSLLFVFSAAFLSAFLDALTVMAVLIAVAVGFYHVYKNVAERAGEHGPGTCIQ